MKRFIAILLVIALTAAVSITGTMAYLQDEDEAVNVMTLGNVSIEQIEQERDANGNLVDFTQAKPAYPSVYEGTSIPWADPSDWPVEGDEAWKVVADNAGVIDKFVSVKNTGKSPAYVRTILAFEVGKDAENAPYMHLIHNGNNVAGTTWSSVWATNENGEDVLLQIDGNWYAIYVMTYTGVLPAGETTIPGLKQIYLDKTATNEVCEAYGGSFEILAISQAVQTAGFADPYTALDTAFGPVTQANVDDWFGGMTIYAPDMSIPAAEVVEGVITLKDGEKRVLTGDIAESIQVTGEGELYLRNVTITADDKNALTVDGQNVKLVAEYDVQLNGAAGGNGIYVPAGAKLDLSGKGGYVTAVGNNGVDDGNGGSGIGGAGTIYIHDLNELDAQGYGIAGFGIGGASTNITIENTTVTNAQGGYVQPNFVNDTSYGKSEPEGGAAIGSLTDGAVITLKNVTVENAQGGSKAAAIGARYWTGVTVDITDSVIKNAQGGNASAGIGGSRIAGDATAADNVVITIRNSQVTAKGGEFAAGIGSGYDTHCLTPDKAPMHTINITGNSVINATGGKYGAGIGTGYHVAMLNGKIEDSVTVNATAGASREKYTYAMDVGFGVIDHSREAKKGNPSSFTYKGSTITVDTPERVK